MHPKKWMLCLPLWCLDFHRQNLDWAFPRRRCLRTRCLLDRFFTTQMGVRKTCESFLTAIVFSQLSLTGQSFFCVFRFSCQFSTRFATAKQRETSRGTDQILSRCFARSFSVSGKYSLKVPSSFITLLS